MQRRCDDSQNEDGDIQSIRYYMTAVRGLEMMTNFWKKILILDWFYQQ